MDGNTFVNSEKAENTVLNPVSLPRPSRNTNEVTVTEKLLSWSRFVRNSSGPVRVGGANHCNRESTNHAGFARECDCA